MTLNDAIERLYNLRPGTTPVEEGAPLERPHQPLLWLAVRGWSVSLQAVPGASCSGFPNALATPDHIPWRQALRDRVSARFLLVKKHNDKNTPENPISPSAPRHYVHSKNLRALASWRFKILIPATTTPAL